MIVIKTELSIWNRRKCYVDCQIIIEISNKTIKAFNIESHVRSFSFIICISFSIFFYLLHAQPTAI